MQRPTMSSKFRERLAREAEIGNAIDSHDDIATRIAEKILGSIIETLNARLGYLSRQGGTMWAGQHEECRRQIAMFQSETDRGSSAKSLISTELEPLMKVLVEAVKWSYIIAGRVLRCEVCKVRTSFEAGHPFSSKLMRHKADCWVDQAQKLIRRADESAS